ncbi:Ester hydrolase-like protein [Cyphellophora attinorum]|uniref:Ester hydrolase-like protein n=1 Tax=Cyphellophora attinorum TaxID=1664694 RepID=A0A0N1H4U3_9EURO|nr:Ester hydrolase-like protein [Phialophora attinorum]KPI40477.1 Ester hydrolase-like protein [Phialophora attinorum]
MTLPVEKLELSSTTLADLASVISSGLRNSFSRSSCTVTITADLRLPPYHLAAPGLSGSPRVVDIGSPPSPPTQPHQKIRPPLHRQTDRPPAIPRAAHRRRRGPFHTVGKNCELAPNIAYSDGGRKVVNRTHYTKLEPGSDGSLVPQCLQIEEESTGFALMANLYGSQGLPGEALHITATARTGSHASFTDAIQDAIREHYGPDHPLISLGGVFVLKRGKANFHVMPDFPGPKEPELDSDEAIAKWLRYFDFEAPVVALSVLHTCGEDVVKELGLRVEHSHCFSEAEDGSKDQGTGRGGHYHYDVDETKDVVEYEGWFNVAEWVYRVDRPGPEV